MSTDDPAAQSRMLRAPLSCAFFLLAQAAGLSANELCQPAIALDLAARARQELDPWSSHAAEARQEVLVLADRIEQLVHATLTGPDARWWSEPLPLERQIWVGSSSDGMLRTVEPPAEPTSFEVYAQQPLPWFITSTEHHGRSALHSILAHQVGDWEPQYPLRQARLNPNAPARVYEINAAEDWHALAARYAPKTSAERTARGAHGMVGGLPPAWSAVAHDWDAVHLTFMGFLTASYVLAGTAANPTTLWAWDCERTLWLRDPPGFWTELAPLNDRPNPVFDMAPLRLRAAEPGRSAATAWLRGGYGLKG